MEQKNTTFRNKTAQLYTEWLPLIENLSDSEAGKILKNILNYQNGDEIESSNPVWFFILNKLEDYNGNYEEIRGKRIEAGRLGGIAKASKCQQVLAKPSKSTNKTKQNKTKPNKTKKIPFEDFYVLYPIKKSKGKAEQSWNNLDKETQQKCIDVINSYEYKCWLEEQDMKFVKHPSTWLNQECWEDELSFEPKLPEWRV